MHFANVSLTKAFSDGGHLLSAIIAVKRGRRATGYRPKQRQQAVDACFDQVRVLIIPLLLPISDALVAPVVIYRLQVISCEAFGLIASSCLRILIDQQLRTETRIYSTSLAKFALNERWRSNDEKFHADSIPTAEPAERFLLSNVHGLCVDQMLYDVEP